MEKRAPQTIDLVQALLATYPELPRIAAAAGDTPLYVVGGAVRDLFAGRGRSDLDLAVEGDPSPIAARLAGPGADPVRHDRFQTAALTLGGLRVDLARTRLETYSRPGALPRVAPASIEDDLARRDFTINAMAVRVGRPDDASGWRLLDPYGGREDLEAGILRLLHRHSIRDDPTRALRGARYAAGYGLEPEPETAAQLTATRLADVSWERRRADLLRITGDEHALAALALIESWGVAQLRPGWRRRAEGVRELLAGEGPWRDLVPLPEALLAAVWPEAAPAAADRVPPEPPSNTAKVAWARRRDPIELLLARADGADWLDDYMARLRHIELEIDGADLIAAGLAEGPAIGRGLKAALSRKLDGEIEGREAELAVALAAARAADSAPDPEAVRDADPAADAERGSR